MEILHSIDWGILDLLQSIHNDVLNIIMMIFTYLGENGYFWISLTIVFLCIPRTRRIGVFMAITLIIEFTLNDLVIKQIVRRDRPFITDPSIDTIIKHPSGFSFPSGHTASSFACATAISMHKKVWGIAAFVIAAMIALSRLYFGVHYPTDVFTGALLGILVGIAVNKLLNFIDKNRHNSKNAENNTTEEM